MAENTRNLRKKITAMLLPVVLIASLLVRLISIESFKIYKDSFKFLFIAKATASLAFVSNYYSNYSDFKAMTFLSPYKWLFSYTVGLIAKFLSLFGMALNNSNFENIAHSVVILSAVFCVLVLYLLLYKVNSSRVSAFSGALFFGLSGIPSILSGFLITDNLSRLFFLIF